MQLIWSTPALTDVRGIDEWLTKQARPEIAARTLAAIRSRAAFLETFPRGGRPLAGGHRMLVVYDTPYLIRYQLGDAAVEILRVHHEREPWQRDA